MTTVKFYKEDEALKYIEDIAILRIIIFREYPYLYDRDYKYEKNYLHNFMNTPDSMICIAFDNGRVVGALTGLPLAFEEENVKSPWYETDYDIKEIYYFSEALLRPKVRGKGLCVEFLKVAEDWVKGLNKYKIFTLATVIRGNDHPKKPKGYKSVDTFCANRGYEKTNNVICTIPWKEVDEEESEKPLLFWFKNT